MDQTEQLNFGTWNYVVFAAMLLLSAFVGIYFACTGGRQRTTEEVLLGDRKMHVLPIAMSLAISYISGATIIGMPAEVYLFDTMYIWTVIIGFFGNLLTCRFYLPVIFRLHITSIYEVNKKLLAFQQKIFRLMF